MSNRFGKNNPHWKGKNVGLNGLHYRYKQKIPKPETCDICKNKKPIDFANISGKYLHSINDWYWLCRRCHMLSDGRMKNNLLQFQLSANRSKATKKAWITRKHRHPRR